MTRPCYVAVLQALLPAIAVCILGACGGPAATTGSGRSGAAVDQLIISVHGQPPTLNPLLSSGPGGLEPDFLFSFLTRVDADGNTGPDLITEVPTLQNGGIARDGLSLIYHLRRNVRWHDGRPLTSGDVAFTFAAMKDPRNDVSLPAPFDDVRSVTVIDPYSFRVALKAPNSQVTSTFFASAWALPIVPAHGFPGGPGSLNHADFNGAPIGSGPYRLVQWVRGDHVTLEANPYYFKGVPHVRRLLVRFNEWETAFNEFRSGGLDALLNVPVNYYTTVSKLPNQTTYRTPTAGYNFIAFNMRNAVTADPAVRRAIALGINRQFLANGATRGAVDASTAVKGIFNAFYDPHVAAPAYDLPAARRLLDAAGWRAGADGLRRKNGVKLTLRIISSTDFVSQTVDIVVQQQLHVIGVDVNVKTFDLGALFDGQSGPIARGEFELFFTSFYALPAYYPAWFFTCDAARISGNYGAYCDPVMDGWYHDSLRRFDTAGLQRDFTRMQRRMFVDMPILALWQYTRVDVCRSTFVGCDTHQTWPVAGIERWHGVRS